MIGDDLLVQEGKEQERKARNEDKGEDVTVQRQQSPEEQSPEEQSAKPHSRTDKAMAERCDQSALPSGRAGTLT